MKTTLALITSLLTCVSGTVAQASGNDPSGEVNNRFGFALYKAIETHTDQGNKFLCPVSAELALTMACNGATGETSAELERLLGVEGQPLEVVNARKAGLLAALARIGGTDFQLSLANSLWARRGFDLRKSFVHRVINAFQARVSALDFDAKAILP